MKQCLDRAKMKNFVFEGNVKEMLTDKYIDVDVFNSLSKRKQLILTNIIPSWVGVIGLNEMRSCLKLIVAVWKYKYNTFRDNEMDYISMCLCALEIYDHDCTEGDAWKFLQWCHRIQNSISNDNVVAGWRVSYGRDGLSDRYFYKNEKLKQQKVISFYKT